jgi:hypothetical protein
MTKTLLLTAAALLLALPLFSQKKITLDDCFV